MTWTPSVANCDQYMESRTGKYEWRAVRYRAAIDWMIANGLRDGMTVFDIGAGMTEFAFCMMNEYKLNVRYIPIDGGIDGTNLEEWTPSRDGHFFVALELIEHLHNWERLVDSMKLAATMGVVLSTPNPRTTDVLGMDPTHVRAVWPGQLEGMKFDVSEQTFYGGVFSNGEPDSLLATWRK